MTGGYRSSIGDWLLPLDYYTDILGGPDGQLSGRCGGPPSFLVSPCAGSVMRLTRSQMLEVLRQDYVQHGLVKGAARTDRCHETCH